MANQGRINYTIGFNVDQTGLNQLKTSLNNLQNLTAKDLIHLDGQQAKDVLKDISIEAKRVETALQTSFNPTLNTYNIDTFRKKLKESGADLPKIRQEFSKAGVQGTIAFRNLANAVSSTKMPLQETHDLLRSMGTTLTNTVKWSIASNAINTVTGSVQKAWSYTKQLDESLNNIMIVTDKSSDSMAQFARQANKAAKELGKSTKDYTNASLIYYQQGLSDAEVAARTETTLKAANVTGQNTEVVSEQLTAVWNGYKVQAQEAELYIDKLAAVAATTAADLEELSTGMSKVASAANTMGVDIDQLNAQLATIVSVTRQAPESVGTALKTVYARISDIESGISDEATLGEYTKQMAEMGINVLDANGKLRDQGEVIEEIGNKWTKMSREQQVALSQTMAGTRQYNNLLALFDNWSMYEKAMKTSANAAGTLQKQQDTYMESMEAHLEQLSTAGERVYQALFDADSAKDLIDVLTKGVDLFANFVESIGGGGTLLMSLVPIMTRLFSGTIASGLTTFIINFKNAKTQAAELKSTLETLDEIKNYDGIDQYTKKIIKLRKAVLELNQMGVISNEKYNEYDDKFNKFASTANKVDLKKKQLYGEKDKETGEIKGGTENRYEAFVNNSGFFDTSKLEAFDFKALQQQGEQLAQGVDIDQAGNYDIISLQFEELRGQVSATSESFKKFDKDSSLIIKNFLKSDTEEIETPLNDLESKFGDVISNMQNMTKIPGLKGLEGTIGRLENKFLQMAQEVKAGKRPITDLEECFESAGKVINNMTNRGIGAINELEVEINEIADGVFPKLEQEAEGAGIQIAQSLMRDQLEAKIIKITNLASNLGMALSGFQVLTNIGDIWENDDLTAGEKVLQTVQNLVTATSMLSPAIMAIVKAYGAEKVALASVNKERAKSNAQKVTETKLDETTAVKKRVANRDKGKKYRFAYNKTLNDDIAKEIDNAKSKRQIDEIISKYRGIEGRDNEKSVKLRRYLQDISQSNSGKVGLSQEQKDEFKKLWTDSFEEDTIKELKFSKRDGENIAAPKLKNSKKIKNTKINKPKENIPDADVPVEEATEKLAKNSDKAGKGASKLPKSFSAALPYVIAIAAAVAAIAGTLAIANAINEKEKKNWEAASEAAKSAADHLNKVQEEWSNLESSISNLDNASKNFDELTEGTVEWQKALMDVNSQVMELIEKYPELIKYTTTDISGQMSISAAGLHLAKEKQLEELKSAQTASTLANLRKDQAEIELKKNNLAEADIYGSFGQDNAIAATAMGAGGTALAGAAIGAAIGSAVPIIGTAIGAAAGLVIGVVGGTAITQAYEQAEEKYKDSLDNNPQFKAAMEAYKSGGDKVFNSYTNLAAALGKEISQLSSLEKSLVDNAKETKALAEIYVKEQALRSSRIQEIGTAIAGDKASQGEKSFIGSRVVQEQERIYQELRDNQGFNQQDKAEAIEALGYLGISPENFVGTKGSNKIQFIDENGQEQTKTMEEIHGILAQYRAEEWAKSNFESLSKALKDGLNITDESLRNMWMAAGDSGFSLSGYTIGEVQKFNADNLTEEGWKALAEAYGVDVNQLTSQIIDVKTSAARALSNPGDLEGEALSYFNSIINSLEDYSGIILEDYTRTANMFGDLFARFSKEGANLFYTVLNKSGDKADDLINKLDEIIWSENDAYSQFVQVLDELGISMDANIVNAYVEQMRELNGAYGYSIDYIQQMVKDLRDIGKVKKGDVIEADKYEEWAKKYGEEGIKALFTTAGDGNYLATADTQEYSQYSKAYIQGRLKKDAGTKRDRAIELMSYLSSYEEDFAKESEVEKQLKTAEQNKEKYIKEAGEKGYINPNITFTTNGQTSNNAYITKTQLEWFKENSEMLREDELERLFKDGFSGNDINYSVSQTEAKEWARRIQYNLAQESQRKNTINEKGLYAFAKDAPPLPKTIEEYNNILKEAAEDYDEIVEELKNKYGDEYGKTKEEIKAIYDKQIETNLETYSAYLSTATSFEDLSKMKNEASNVFGINFDLSEATQEEYQKQINRVGVQLAASLGDTIGLSIEAIDEYVGNADIESWKKAFKELTEGFKAVDREIERLNDTLSDLENEAKDLVGQNAIDNIKNQIAVLEEESKKYSSENITDRAKKNRDTVDSLVKSIEGNFTDFNLGFTLDKLIEDNGNFNQANYDEILNWWDGAQTLIADENQRAKIQEQIDDILKLGEDTENYRDAGKEVERKLKEANLAKWEMELEFKLDEQETKKKINDFTRKLNEDNRVLQANTFVSDYEAEIESIKIINMEMKELDQLLKEEQITRDQWVTAYGEQLQKLQDAQLDAQEAIKEIEQSRVDALEDISEAYEKQATYLEQINSLLETQKSAFQLAYGEDAYEILDSLYTRSLGAQVDIQRQAGERFAAAQAKFKDIDNLAISDEEREAIIQEYTEAGNDYASALYSTMESRRDKYLNDTEVAIKSFNKAVYGSLDTELFEKEWDWTKSQQDKYFDSIQSMYEKDSLAAAFDTAANNAKSISAQEQINKLKREELAQLEKIDKLSEYDLERARQKLSVLEAEIALREAQENKTQMRLMRGSDGSYSYQYIADQSAINEAQEKLNEAQSDLYNLDLENYISSIDEFQESMTELAQIVRELGEDGFTDEELAFITERKEEIEQLAKRSQDIRDNVLDSAKTAAETFGVDLSTITEGTILDTTNKIDQIIKDVAENGIQDSYETLMSKLTVISNEYIDEQKDSVSQLTALIGSEGAQDSLINAYTILAGKQDIAIEKYQSEYDYLTTNLVPKLDDLKKSYDNVALSIDAVTKAYEKLRLEKAKSDNSGSDVTTDPVTGTVSGSTLTTTETPPPQTETVDLNQENTGPSYTIAGKELYVSDSEFNSTLGADWVGKNIQARSLGDTGIRGGSFFVLEKTGEYTQVSAGGTLGDANGDAQELKIVDSKIYLNANGTKFVKTVPRDQEDLYYKEGDAKAWVRYIPLRYAWELRSGSNGWLDTKSSFDTGGYTGEWGPSGKQAILHEKELVLNKQDTANFLDALDILRSLNLSMLDKVAQMGTVNNFNQMVNSMYEKTPIQQNVVINADFPNVEDKDEIKEAFNDIINLATQYIHQDNKF